MSANPKRYAVYWRDEKVLDVTAEPGPLLSKKAPPPGPNEAPALNPFLSATAYLSEQENILREALGRSSSLPEYLATLRSIGFSVVEERE